MAFEITNNCLEKYIPKEEQTEVVIPNGVTKIDRYAFKGCTGLTSVTLPENLTEIGMDAFEGCTGLTSVTLPESVTKIEWRAFEGCTGLTEVTIPKNVTDIGPYQFADCRSLKNICVSPENNAFSAVGAMLLDKKGERLILAPGASGDLVIPDGVIEIKWGAFRGCTELTSVTFPESVTKIEVQAFDNCSNLTNIIIKSSKVSVGEDAFHGVPATVMEQLFTSGVKLHPSHVEGICSDFICACAIAYQSGKTWDAATAKYINDGHADSVFSELVKLVEEGKGAVPAVKQAASYLKILSPKTIKALHAALEKSKAKCLKDFVGNKEIKKILSGKEEDISKLHPVEQLVRAHKKVYTGAKEICKLVGKGIPYADGSGTCSPEALIQIFCAYAEQDEETPKECSLYKTAYCQVQCLPDVDAIAAGLDQKALQELLKKLAYRKGGGLLVPYGRYASREQITALVTDMNKWKDWNKYGIAGRKNMIYARGGLMLSDTREAMMAVEKAGGLDYYAKLRGTDADTLRDTALADFGLDESGKKVYDLGGKTVTVSLADDLTPSILDDSTGKVAKSIPKKDADPAFYESAVADLADLKKNLKRVAKIRCDQLFADFLSGAEKSGESWVASYTKNPLLRQIARLLVWSQGKDTFTLDADGKASDAGGKDYAVAADKPVAVAHPIEMQKAEIEAWQKYFAAKGLKQPFEQVWEPVHDEKTILPGRYEGCVMPVYWFSGKDKHGIHAYGLTAFSEDFGFELDDCKLAVDDCSTWRFEPGWTDDATFTLGKFTFKKYTRAVNHIVYLLDKRTVAQRIEKDDVTAITMLDGFTLAQITELLNLAIEKQAANCITALLEYKNTHFADYDPMDAFTLE